MNPVEREIAITRLREIFDEMTALSQEQHSLIMYLAKGPDMSPSLAMELMHQSMSNREIARLDRILKMTGRTKRTIYRWMDELGFPRPDKSGGMAWWDVAAVKTWWAENEAVVGRWPTQPHQS